MSKTKQNTFPRTNNVRGIYSSVEYDKLTKNSRINEKIVERVKQVMVDGYSSHYIARENNISRQAMEKNVRKVWEKLNPDKKRICLDLPEDEFNQVVKKYRTYISKG